MTGRPPMYDSPEKLQAAVDEYFAQFDDPDCEQKPTISGLAYHLGFESRQSFYDYERKERFTYAIKRARFRIEGIYEQRLHATSQVAGPIFALKNMGWSDSQSLELTGKDGGPVQHTVIWGKYDGN